MKPLVVGNWKMNTTRPEAAALVGSMLPELSALSDRVEVVLLPPFPWLTDVARLLEGSRVVVGAQSMHAESGGAYTGEVSARMLSGVCEYVLVGQYERRILFSEKDALVRRKLQVAQLYGIKPILCVGETADQFQEGVGASVIADQLESNLDGVTLDERLVIAYDPAWTTMGLVAPPPLAYAAEMVAQIRHTLGSVFSSAAAEQVRLIYAGAVSNRSIDEIVAEPRVDGVMAGAASLNPTSFTSFVRAFASARSEGRC